MESLYPYPFDRLGRQLITLAESVAVMRALEWKLQEKIGTDWRWSELDLRIVALSRHTLEYDVVWKGRYRGRLALDLIQALKAPTVPIR
jgi:hypothetical protein